MKTKIPETLTVAAVRARYQKANAVPIAGMIKDTVSGQTGYCILGIGALGLPDTKNGRYRDSAERAAVRFKVPVEYARGLEAGWENWRLGLGYTAKFNAGFKRGEALRKAINPTKLRY